MVVYGLYEVHVLSYLKFISTDLYSYLDMLLKVYHAYWFGKNTDCVALKIYINEYFNQELYVLNFLNGVNVHERNHIIKMLG